MTEPEEKGKPVVPTRTPKKKVSTGIFDNLRKLPEPHPVEEILGLVPASTTTGSTPSRPSTTPTPSRPSIPAGRENKAAVAPERDYAKVANSIVRHAVPSGIFGENGGKAKELYDTLYALTRGAVVPNRKIRIPKYRLMKKAGIGSEVTLRKNLERLRAVGLVKELIVPGAHGGNEYEVHLPDEVGLTGSTPSTPSTPSTGSNPRQNLEGVEALETRGSRASLSPDSTSTSGKPKTSSLRPKETFDDDAALAGLTASLAQASLDITGKELSSAEAQRWRELADVLVTELKIAAARTTVSSLPAFLAEHLRRRLWKIDPQQARAEGRELPDQASSATAREEASNCPDCGGSGWWYPEGEGKGVAKCRHARLKAGAEAQAEPPGKASVP